MHLILSIATASLAYLTLIVCDKLRLRSRWRRSGRCGLRPTRLIAMVQVSRTASLGDRVQDSQPSSRRDSAFALALKQPRTETASNRTMHRRVGRRGRVGFTSSALNGRHSTMRVFTDTTRIYDFLSPSPSISPPLFLSLSLFACYKWNFKCGHGYSSMSKCGREVALRFGVWELAIGYDDLLEFRDEQ